MDHSRNVREQRLASAQKRLMTANEALRIAHLLPTEDMGNAEAVQRAQELVITIEQEVGLLQNGLNRDYSTVDTTRS